MAKEILNSQIDLVSEHYVYKGSWIQLFRPLTLTGTLSPVLVGTAFAAKSGTIRLDIFLAILMAALFIQSSTNVLNDYYDRSEERRVGKECRSRRARYHLRQNN